MFIIKYKKIFLSVSLALVLLSISSLFVYKLPLGIDFKGGALTEITYTDVRPNVEVINQALSNNQSLGTVLVQPEGDKNIIVRTKDLNESERQVLISALNSTGTFTINNYTSIGPSVGKDLKNKRYVTFAETVGNSLEQVYTRSINTSMTVIIVLVALSIFGPSTTKVFALMMTAGMFFGTYSSIFLASPMLVLAEELQNRKK